MAPPCPLLQGSAEAVRDALAHMCTEQVRVQVRSAAVVGCCVDAWLRGWAAQGWHGLQRASRSNSCALLSCHTWIIHGGSVFAYTC